MLMRVFIILLVIVLLRGSETNHLSKQTLNETFPKSMRMVSEAGNLNLSSKVF